ncbi:MAG: hypothetical protein V7K14_10260 [Nostoc sp.]|uniref:DUF6414 family protein n=1 Tax=Nostoc sp. TaxID=1180 RepID=UPI002FF80F74
MKSENNGSATSLKHFIYLDRNRLNSYSSQLEDGIIQLRRLTENLGNKTADVHGEKYTEKTEEKARDIEVSLGPKNIMGGVSAKGNDKLTKKEGYKEGAKTIMDESSESFSQDKIDYHNTYLIFEKQLIAKGILKEIRHENQLKQYASLIKITGTSKFFDWNSLLKLCDEFGNLIVNNSPPEEALQADTAKVMLQAIKLFSLGEITLHTKIGNSILISSLNVENLCMTKDQLRSTYVMPGDVETTIVGFVPKRRIEQTTFPGLAGTLNMAELWTQMAGEVQTVIDPLAIYTEIHI